MEERLAAGDPVISVDTKKKELVGDFKHAGRELRPKGNPEKVRVHDFIVPELGRANPYGVYDLANNTAWVSVGVDHDTATVAVESIRRWWLTMGGSAFPAARRLLITAGGGGSDGFAGDSAGFGARADGDDGGVHARGDRASLRDARADAPGARLVRPEAETETVTVEEPEGAGIVRV